MAALQQTPITFQSRSPPPTQLINGPIAKLSFSGGLKLPKLTIKLRSKRISRRGGGALGAKMSASAAGSYALSLADVAKSNETLEQTSTDLEKLEQISKKTRTQKKPKMANSTIQFGILGCADIARKVSRAILLSQTATLYAVGSRSIEKAKKFAADNNFPATAKVCGSYDEVLDDPNVDAVYVPLPTSLHIKWAVAAAQKKKHLLLEKPVALNVEEVDVILEACESNGVQFMDGTVWMHHPRTAKMREFLSDLQKFGELKLVNACFTFAADQDFLENNIRVKPDLDALGALGDVGWYCIRGILWAADFELPKSVIALRNPVLNKAGVIISCGASLSWEDGKVATFHCSFLSNLTMDLTVVGTKGTLHVHDFVNPYEEEKASFISAVESGFKELLTGWEPKPSEHTVMTDTPQEALMVREFCKLVGSIKNGGAKPDKKWPTLSRKTTLVLDAVSSSIKKGFEAVEIVC